MRKFTANKNGTRLTVIQEDSITFDDEIQAHHYLDRQRRELEQLRAQKQRLSEIEQTLVQHIAELELLVARG